MRDRRLLFCAVVLFGGAMMATSALAWTPNPECISGAREEFKLCVSKCQDEFKTDRDTCRQINHECAEECREDFEECVDIPLDELANCKGVCNSELTQGRAVCRETTKWGTSERDNCIDLVQLLDFGCRDQCREGVQAKLTECRLQFRACIKACPPPEEPQ